MPTSSPKIYNGATKTRSLNGQAQVRPSTLTTPTGKKWSINRIYYTPNPNDTVKFTTDLMGIKYNGTQKFIYSYDANGLVGKFTDKYINKSYYYKYDMLGRLQRTDISGIDSIVNTYDNFNNTTGSISLIILTKICIEI